MFHGEHFHSLDEKGRVILPVKFREAFADGLFIVKSFDNYLEVYTRADWTEYANMLSRIPPTASRDLQDYKRFIFASAEEGEISRQGRISIPQNHREYARLEKDIVIVGVLNKLEIWAKESYGDFTAGVIERKSSILEQVSAYRI